MINLLGKVNRFNYKNFSRADFSGYEVFLGAEEDFKYLPAIMRRLNVVSVHEPAKNFDLASAGQKGEESNRLMVKLLTCLADLDFRGVMVIHGAFFNETVGERTACLKTLAGRLDRLAARFPGIKISLETDILFFNQILDNRALLALPEDFLALKKYLKGKLYITLDFEHVLISSLFQDFIGRHKQFYLRVKNLADLKKPRVLELEAAWLNYLKKNRSRLDKIFSANLNKFVKLKPAIVNFHLSPSNMLKYWYDEKIFAPLQGEHLSVKETDDKLNYKLIKSYLPKLSAGNQINVVIEIWPRQVRRYVKELKKSGKLIKKIWRLKK